MDDTIEWVTAALLLVLLAVCFMFGGVFIIGLAAIGLIVVGIAITLDAILLPIRWFLSLFSERSEENERGGTRE